MRETSSKTLCFVLMGLVLTASAANAESRQHTVTIDGEEWTITRDAPACEGRAEAAIRRYWEVPAYRVERKVSAERYFVNGTSDCWIELDVQGVDDSAVIFKVSEDGTVIATAKGTWAVWRKRPSSLGGS